MKHFLMIFQILKLQNEFFDEPAASTLKYLDMLYQQGDMEKSKFFKNVLARTLRLLPQVRM